MKTETPHKILTVLFCLAALPLTLCAEEGGGGHYTPGATASFIDTLPYEPGFAYVNQFLYYGGDISGKRSLPLGRNLAAGVEATSCADVNVLLYQSSLELLGGRYAAAFAIPLARMDIDVSGTLTRNPRRPGQIVPVSDELSRSKTISDTAEGLGDIYVAPFMLVWKKGDWKADTRLGLYAPTGKYDQDDLANIGKNYWTFEPGVSLSYLGSKNGVEVTSFAGFDFNTENQDTDYKTGEQAHLDLTVAQHLPLGKGFIGLGATGFYYQQVAGDSGDGAALGGFEGRSAGVGPVLSYAAKIGDSDLVFEVKWLPELETEKRLEGDYVWMKAAVLF